MSLLEPDAIRRKRFETTLLGYHSRDVESYLARIALAIEVVAESLVSEPQRKISMPPDLTPARIRARLFDRRFRGYHPAAVRAYLNGLADEGEALLDGRAPPAVAHPGPLPYVAHRPTTNPVLPVADMEQAAAFYEALGFEVSTWDDTYAWVKHCEWEWCHLRVAALGEPSGAGAYFHVDDAEAWHGAIAAASDGKVELGAVGDMPWGKREFAIHDPWGNWLRFGSPI